MCSSVGGLVVMLHNSDGSDDGGDAHVCGDVHDAAPSHALPPSPMHVPAQSTLRLVALLVHDPFLCADGADGSVATQWRGHVLVNSLVGTCCCACEGTRGFSNVLLGNIQPLFPGGQMTSTLGGLVLNLLNVSLNVLILFSHCQIFWSHRVTLTCGGQFAQNPILLWAQ